MSTIAYRTFGCKVNQYETEKIRQELEKLGFRTIPFDSSADVYIVNSCAVTHTAESKSLRALRQAVRNNPNAMVISTGCLAELEPDRSAAIQGVTLVINNDKKPLIPQLILERFPDVQPNGHRLVRPRIRTRALVKVQDGCNQFCSYCTVPYARSMLSSRSLQDVTDELQALAGFGYKEVVLTGIRLGSYEPGLPMLIKAASKVDGLERIRLSSVEVWELGDELLDEVAGNPKVCRHLHIPLQSGSERVLKGMNRPYSPAEYKQVIEKARKMISDLAVTTDVIVGFPGEGEEEFEESLGFVEEMQFSRLHVFRYSPRSRTKASGLPNQVPEPEKTRRSEQMIQIGSQLMRSFTKRLVGQSVPVLVESRRAEILSGFTDNYVEVRFAGSEGLRGRILPVRVQSVDLDGTARGSIENDE